MKTIPMLDLKLEYEFMKNDVDAAIQKCLNHQQWILGPEVKQLEERISQYLTAKHSIGVSSGTDALVLALRALALQQKGREYFNRDELIITTPLTFTATGDAILRSGATPLFVDIDPETFNIDPEKIKKCLLSHQNVVGIVPVHLYGLSCEMDKIMAIANDNKLFVVEDVAQAFGGSWKGKKLGTIGDLGAFSFFPSKNLGGFGDGGMVSTNNKELFELVNMLRKHGGKDKYNVDHIGYNARLDTIQAAVLLAKLKYVDEFNQKRREIAKIYDEKLKNLTEFKTPRFTSEHVFHQYTIQVLNGKRDEIQALLKSNGIDTMIYYPILLHKMKVFAGWSQIFSSLSIAEKLGQEVLSLPIEPLMPMENIHYVCEKLSRII